MNRRILAICGIVFLLAPLTAPAPADAQGLMRRLKEKAQDAVGAAVSEQPPSSTTPAASNSSRPGSTASTSVVQITPEVLQRFETALRAEAADRAEVTRLLAPEAAARYQRCSEAAMMGPDAAKLADEFAPRFEGPDPQQALGEYNASIEAMVSRSCGPKPENAETLRRRPLRVGSEAGGFDAREYAMLKERTLPFCGRQDAGTRIPGQGKNIFYVYSEAEVAALQAGCPPLQPLLSGDL